MNRNRKTSAQLRYGEVSGSELNIAVTHLENLKRKLEILANQVGEDETLRIDGATKFTRGSELIEDYIKYVEKSVIQRKYSK